MTREQIANDLRELRRALYHTVSATTINAINAAIMEMEGSCPVCDAVGRRHAYIVDEYECYVTKLKRQLKNVAKTLNRVCKDRKGAYRRMSALQNEVVESAVARQQLKAEYRKIQKHSEHLQTQLNGVRRPEDVKRPPKGALHVYGE